MYTCIVVLPEVIFNGFSFSLCVYLDEFNQSATLCNFAIIELRSVLM